MRGCFCSSPARAADLKVKVPPMAESISEGILATFHKRVGDCIDADEELASIETDKIDVAVQIPEGGVIMKLLVEEGDVVTVGQPIARVETGTDMEKQPPQREEEEEEEEEASKPDANQVSSSIQQELSEQKPSTLAKDQPAGEPPREESASQSISSSTTLDPRQTPSFTSIHGSAPRGERLEPQEKMSRMRKTIATRLKQSQNMCASLTTVQEIDMSALIAWRAKYKEDVAKQHGVRLGYMGAFAKATTMAAKQVPEVNASIDIEREMITFRDYVDISIAVSSPKGLVTPAVRNCESLSIIEVEKEIAILAQKARDSKLTIEDLTGGNFSISNPGIFNSLFGTPVINYPQAAVFNMNTIKDRVVAIDGKVEIRPMMYVTLTYDHRLIDGREAVTFLNVVKRYIEDPSRMLLE
ncbi:hypothetical protein GGI43DRAFT_426694 [Trichoderma evansii]